MKKSLLILSLCVTPCSLLAQAEIPGVAISSAHVIVAKEAYFRGYPAPIVNDSTHRFRARAVWKETHGRYFAITFTIQNTDPNRAMHFDPYESFSIVGDISRATLMPMSEQAVDALETRYRRWSRFFTVLGAGLERAGNAPESSLLGSWETAGENADETTAIRETDDRYKQVVSSVLTPDDLGPYEIYTGNLYFEIPKPLWKNAKRHRNEAQAPGDRMFFRYNGQTYEFDLSDEPDF